MSSFSFHVSTRLEMFVLDTTTSAMIMIQLGLNSFMNSDTDNQIQWLETITGMLLHIQDLQRLHRYYNKYIYVSLVT